MQLRSTRARRLFLGLVATAGTAALMGVTACANWVGRSDEDRDKRRGGPAGLLVDAALEEGDLSPEQEEAILAIRERMHAERGDRREMKQNLRAAASEVVRTGTTDSEEFNAALERAVDGIEQRIVATTGAMKEIHALLEPRQRALVASAVRERLSERAERRRDHQSRLDRVAARLVLDAVQIDAVTRAKDELVGWRKEIRPSEEEIAGMLDAFEGEDFPVALDELRDRKVELARNKVAVAAQRADGLLSVLSEDQRYLLAEIIERGPRAMGL